MVSGGSHPFDKTIHHALLAGAVERDGELVAVQHSHVTVAELLVKHPVAEKSEAAPVDFATSSPSMENHP